MGVGDDLGTGWLVPPKRPCFPLRSSLAFLLLMPVLTSSALNDDNIGRNATFTKGCEVTMATTTTELRRLIDGHLID